MQNTYESPLNSRYASKEMQYIFSPDKKFSTWRKLWIALAETEYELGLSSVTKEQIEELKAHADDINFDVAKAREKEKERLAKEKAKQLEKERIAKEQAKEKERIAKGKQMIKDAFHVEDNKRPRWIQSCEWPMGVKSPMKYVGRRKIDDGAVFIFRDVDTAEIREVEQFY